LSESLIFRLLEAHSGHKAPPLRVSLATLHALAERLREGLPFSDSLAHHPREFQGWEIAALKVGEKTGRMDEAFRDIADVIDGRRSHLLRLAAAAAKPALLQSLIPWIVCAPLAALAGFLAYLGAASALFVAISPIAAILLSPKEGSAFNPGVMPGFAKMQFCRCLAGLIKAGISPDEAIAEAAQAAGTRGLGETGEAIHARLARYRMFSSEELAGLRIAEECGKLDEGLSDLAERARKTWAELALRRPSEAI
jgi:type II secretory pathway component PulF